MKSFKQFHKDRKCQQEDAPTNSVGGGQVAGIAPGEAPPVRMRKFKDKLKKFTAFSVNTRYSPMNGAPLSLK